MEGVGRFSSWYHMPARAYGLVSVQDPVSGCSHRLLAPEAVHKWGAYLDGLSIAIQRNSGLIQAMLLVDGLMMQASLEDPCVFASCACSPARTIRLRQSILAIGEILCDFCSQPFLVVEDFQRWVLEDLKRERRTSMMMHIKRPLTIGELLEAREDSFPSPLAVSPDTTVFEALRLMAERNVGAVIVMDEDEEMTGIFTERDYARKIILMGRSSPDTRIKEIMSHDMVTVDPESTLEEGLALMTQHYIRHLPVMETGCVVGLVSMRDIMTAMIDQKDFAIETLEKYILGREK
jgi:CBS domain-containing protein